MENDFELEKNFRMVDITVEGLKTWNDPWALNPSDKVIKP